MPSTLLGPRDGSSRSGPSTGRTLAGKYRLGELLGKGGRGEVYTALQIDLDARSPSRSWPRPPGRTTASASCARCASSPTSATPASSRCSTAGTDEDGRPYCAMELLEGETLAERLERGGPMDAPEAVALTTSLCLALQVIHDKGFLHRDVKPANVFLARRLDGGIDAKLIDFGIAKRVSMSDEPRQRITQRGLGRAAPTALNVIVGTPRYLSPEQILGTTLDARQRRVRAGRDPLRDCSPGVPPFVADEIGDLLGRIIAEPPPPFERGLRARGAPALERRILSALAKNPAARPAGAAAFAAACRAALAEDGGPAPDAKVSLLTPRRRVAVATAAVAGGGRGALDRRLPQGAARRGRRAAGRRLGAVCRPELAIRRFPDCLRPGSGADNHGLGRPLGSRGAPGGSAHGPRQGAGRRSQDPLLTDPGPSHGEPSCSRPSPSPCCCVRPGARRATA